MILNSESIPISFPAECLGHASNHIKKNHSNHTNHSSDIRRAGQAGFTDVALGIPVFGAADMRGQLMLIALMLFEIGDGIERFAA